MGKRSDFVCVERDFYPTPAAAVAPLIPHLPERFTYWEPCAGDGALINAIKAHAVDPICLYATDIEPQAVWVATKDAMRMQVYAKALDFIITNPPWGRKVLHPMIEHFSDQRPTWLLFDADWIHTKQAAPYLPRLRKIVAIGRLKWIPDSPHTGKDNCAWHLFDKPSAQPAEFYGRVAA